MYGIFVLIGLLLWSSVYKSFFLPSLWTLELAQFAMVAYYVLGGPYSIQLAAHVRMDLLYDRWAQRTKAWDDVLSGLLMIYHHDVLRGSGVGLHGNRPKEGD